MPSLKYFSLTPPTQAELQDLDCKTESARLRPVKPSPFLEKLILDVHKKCKHLEDPLRGWDDELIPNFNKKPSPSSRPDAAESSTNQTGNKGKHSLHWCLGGIPVSRCATYERLKVTTTALPSHMRAPWPFTFPLSRGGSRRRLPPFPPFATAADLLTPQVAHLPHPAFPLTF